MGLNIPRLFRCVASQDVGDVELLGIMIRFFASGHGLLHLVFRLVGGEAHFWGGIDQEAGFAHGREKQLVTIMNTPRQLTSNAPWTAIATKAKARVKGRSVSKARANSATNPHRSQINGILHAVVLRL
jgi:hypothetical protein